MRAALRRVRHLVVKELIELRQDPRLFGILILAPIIQLFVLGAASFALATAGGVLFAKLMNLFSSDKINPIIGCAGVSAVPDSARVAQMVAAEEDPTNFVIMHAMAPNVAGVIGSAIAAGVLLAALR